MADLVAAAKAKPGALNFSSVGVGTATHLSGERFRLSAGIDVVHVPFKGGAEAMAEVIARRIDFFFGPVGLVLPAIRDGRLVPLAVNVTERARALPDVPTMRQAGFIDAEFPVWFGLFAPAKTPSHIVTRLHEMTEKALKSPQVADKLFALASIHAHDARGVRRLRARRNRAERSLGKSGRHRSRVTYLPEYAACVRRQSWL